MGGTLSLTFWAKYAAIESNQTHPLSFVVLDWRYLDFPTPAVGFDHSNKSLGFHSHLLTQSVSIVHAPHKDEYCAAINAQPNTPRVYASGKIHVSSAECDAAVPTRCLESLDWENAVSGPELPIPFVGWPVEKFLQRQSIMEKAGLCQHG